MSVFSKTVAIWVALVVVPHCARARPPLEVASQNLRLLASGAASRSGWSRLRRYASIQSKTEERELAYFVLGYREYEAGEYQLAIQDLRKAAEARSSLSDFAEYLLGASASKVVEAKVVVESLQGFSSRYPESPWRLDALALLARAFLETKEPERAVQALTAEPRVRQHPNLTLLLAEAYGKAQRLKEAAATYREIYYGHPTAPEAGQAGEALRGLEAELGANLPPVSEDIQAPRAEALFGASLFAEARKEYDRLLQARPSSPLVGRWKLGQARCWLHLKKTGQALESLETTTFSDPALEAERLATIIDAHARQHDETQMLRALDELATRFPQSPYRASALFLAGNFFLRQDDWEAAARYYKTLAENFRQDERSREANWRVAWSYYLGKRNAEARQAFVEHIQRHPNSLHLPAALYWLGRLEEQGGAIPEARALYEALRTRFAHSYYALLADRRVATPPLEGAGREKTHGLADGTVAEVARAIPPREPLHESLYETPERDETLKAVSILRGLNLSSLAEPYLKAAISDRPTAPSLVLALSRVEADEGNISAALFEAKKLVPNVSAWDFPELPQDLWDLLYPRAFWKLVERQASAYRLDPYLIMGLIRQESAFNPRATSRANARGLMQILPLTASPGRRGRSAIARKLYDPAYNVRLGCGYLRQVLQKFDGNVELALAAYNAGDSRVKDWLRLHEFREPGEFVETIPITDTRAYVEAVLRDAAIYRELMTGVQKFRKRG